MGTNYYLEVKPPCECCGREYEKEHVGKQSGGWAFLWQGAERRTAREWFSYLEAQTESGLRIYDEYGDEIPLGVFRDTITPPGKGLTLEEYYALPENRRYYHDPKESGEWLDCEGWRFCASEFS